MKISKLFRNVKISTKLNRMQIASILGLGVIVGLIFFCITMLSALRATVGAQGLWEKNQKMAHINLISYLYSQEEIDYINFREAESIVNVYEDLRHEFLNGMPDKKYAFDLMVEGGSRPEDVPAILFLFKHFLFISHMQKAMDYWGATHPLFVVQDSIATAVHLKYNIGEELDLKAAIAAVHAVNADLTYQGTKFSETIGEGSRWMEGLVFKLLIIGCSILGLSLIFVLYLIFNQIKTWIAKLDKGAKAVADGNLAYQIEVDENHELANLSSGFNQMINSISGLISENKTIESHLRDLSLVASETDNAIFICNAKGEVEWVNEAFTKISGFTFDEIVNSCGELLVKEGGRTGLSPDSPQFKEMVETKSSVRYETENFTKSGEKYWIFTSLSPVYNNAGELLKVIAIDVDITKMKQTEQALSLAKDKAEESEQAKQLFLANMSHEIRTPMNAIIGFTELLEQTSLNPNQKESLEAIKSSGKTLMVLINDILDLAKIEAGQITMENISFDIRDILHKVCGMFKPKAQTKNLSCGLIIGKDVPSRLIGDPYRINQIIINLLSNAVKFTDKGFVNLEVSVLEKDTDNVQILVEVIDSGIGVEPEKLDFIFESFTQANSGITREFGGTGLGLSIVKYLVDLMGGELEVKSELGKGTTFSVKIPLQIDKDLTVSTATDKEEINQIDLASTVKASNTKLLLVEDNPVNQLLATRVLSGFGYHIDVAENGQVALNKMKKQKFDLILMDLQMPVLDGFQTTIAIRTSNLEYSHIPIIAMTAHVLQGEKEKCINVGMNDYITKPFSAKELDGLIKSHISSLSN